MAELSLAGACTLAEANEVLSEFLSRFNQRFGVPADQAESAYRRVDPEMDLGNVLCIKELRRVAKDNTVQYYGRTLRLFPGVEHLQDPCGGLPGPGSLPSVESRPLRHRRRSDQRTHGSTSPAAAE